MCDTPQMRLLAYARQGADTEHEIRRLLRFHQQDGVLEFVRQALEERGDLGALRFLERVAEEADELSHRGVDEAEAVADAIGSNGDGLRVHSPSGSSGSLRGYLERMERQA